MNKVWNIVNTVLVVLALPGGYNALAPEQLQNKNQDAVFCGLILLTLPLFAIGSVEYSNWWRGRRGNLARPSFHRNPLNWWGDPLQSLFISTCIAVSTTIGSLLRRPHPAIGSVGFWMIGMYTSFAVGLVIGQLLIYRIYRRRIIAE